MLNVGLIVGSTRPNRFADTPVQWLVEGASARQDLRLTVLDLRDYKLPLFSEPAPPAYAQGAYSQPEAEAWRKRIGELLTARGLDRARAQRQPAAIGARILARAA